MHVFEKNIKELDIIIPELPVALANYIPYTIVNNIMYVSGQAPSEGGKMIYTGKIGENISEDDGVHAAELCCINIIAALKKGLNGNWDKLDSFIKLGGFVNCNQSFVNHPKIINGASDLLVKVFGDKGRHTRFAVGSNSLPMNIAVEIEASIKLK